jgi:hypothetical protein
VVDDDDDDVVDDVGKTKETVEERGFRSTAPEATSLSLQLHCWK